MTGQDFTRIFGRYSDAITVPEMDGKSRLFQVYKPAPGGAAFSQFQSSEVTVEQSVLNRRKYNKVFQTQKSVFDLIFTQKKLKFFTQIKMTFQNGFSKLFGGRYPFEQRILQKHFTKKMIERVLTAK